MQVCHFRMQQLQCAKLLQASRSCLLLLYACVCHCVPFVPVMSAAGPNAVVVLDALDGQTRQRLGATQKHHAVSKAAACHVSDLHGDSVAVWVHGRQTMRCYRCSAFAVTALVSRQAHCYLAHTAQGDFDHRRGWAHHGQIQRQCLPWCCCFWACRQLGAVVLAKFSKQVACPL